MNYHFYKAAYYLECLKQSGQIDWLKSEFNTSENPSYNWKTTVALYIKNLLETDEYHSRQLQLSTVRNDDSRVCIEGLCNLHNEPADHKAVVEICDDATLHLRCLPVVPLRNYRVPTRSATFLQSKQLTDPNTFLRQCQRDCYDFASCTIDYLNDVVSNAKVDPIYPVSVRQAYKVLRRDKCDENLAEVVGAIRVMYEFLQQPEFKYSSTAKKLSFEYGGASSPQVNNRFRVEHPSLRCGGRAGKIYLTHQAREYKLPGELNTVGACIEVPIVGVDNMPKFSFRFENNPLARLSVLASMGIAFDEADINDVRFIDSFVMADCSIAHNIAHEHSAHVSNAALMTLPHVDQQSADSFAELFDKRLDDLHPAVKSKLDSKIANDPTGRLKEAFGKIQSKKMAETLTDLTIAMDDFDLDDETSAPSVTQTLSI